MAYIGNQADTAFTSLIKQDLTGASGTSLTLTHAVANANDIALYINNVRQEPVSAYSTNGTAVSLTGSVVSTDDIYVIYLARAVQTTVPPDGSVSTAKIADSAVTSAKISANLGKVLQCQTVTSDSDTTLSTGQSYQIVGNSTPSHNAGHTLLTKAITPISSTSKIIAQARLYFCEPSNADTGNMATMFKDTSLIGFVGNQLFVYSQFDGLSSNTYQTAIGDMQAVTSGHSAGSAVTFKCNVGSTSSSTSASVRVNNGAGGSGLSYTSFAIPSSLILWEVES